MISARSKVFHLKRLVPVLQKEREGGRKVVFTNGCFDLLHPGHVRYLEAAHNLGDILVVAVNGDNSVKRIKGDGRPIQSQKARCEVLAALHCVDFVFIFHEDTPLKVIQAVRPDVLVKGGDWSKDNIVGRDFVEGLGGEVHAIEFEEGYSTTDIIRRIERPGSAS